MSGELCYDSRRRIILVYEGFEVLAEIAYYSTLNMEAVYSSETSVYFNGLQGAISQMIEVLIFVSLLQRLATCFSTEGPEF
jgi:hypothetical protein